MGYAGIGVARSEFRNGVDQKVTSQAASLFGLHEPYARLLLEATSRVTPSTRSSGTLTRRDRRFTAWLTSLQRSVAAAEGMTCIHVAKGTKD